MKDSDHSDDISESKKCGKDNGSIQSSTTVKGQYQTYSKTCVKRQLSKTPKIGFKTNYR